MNIEDELRASLRREPAPADFATRVLSRAVPRKKLSRSYRAALYAMAAGLVLASVVGYQGLQARRQLLTALTITRTTLLRTQAKVQRVTGHTL